MTITCKMLDKVMTNFIVYW